MSLKNPEKQLSFISRVLLYTLMGMLWILARLPYRLTVLLARAIAWGIEVFSKTTFLNTLVNIKLCFPALSEEAQLGRCRNSLFSVGMSIFETAQAWFLSDNQLEGRFVFEGLEYLQEAQAKNKGIISLGLHLTTAELCGRMGRLSHDYGVMYQPTRNKVIDALLYRCRKKVYNNVIPSHNIRALRHVQSGGVIWYAPDQVPNRKKAVFVPFFGVETATTTTTAQLAKLTGAPILPLFHYRDNQTGFYHLQYYPPIYELPHDTEEENAQFFNEILEEKIKQKPEQYLWIYKRFKMLPKHGPDFYKIQREKLLGKSTT